jgi:hypothetical protein
MKHLLIGSALLLASFATYADSVNYSRADEGKHLLLAKFHREDNVATKVSGTPISGAVSILVNSKKVYTFNVPGPRGYQKRYVQEVAASLSGRITILTTIDESYSTSECRSGEYRIMGQVLPVSLDKKLFLVDPDSVTVNCSAEERPTAF